MIEQKIRELRLKEERLVESIRHEIAPKCEIVYLPNPIPRRKVKHIFIAMEPSFGSWANNQEDAERRINEGFRNFLFSWEDFIFHYCITKYLSPSYYVTDVSKAAMKVRYAKRLRKEIYPKWTELLENEIAIIGQKECNLLFVGKTVEKFLRPRMVNYNILKTILHYSRQAARWRKEIPRKYSKEFMKFKENQTPSPKVILDFAKKLMKVNGIRAKTRRWILREGMPMITELSESRKELMFTYYCEFRNVLRARLV